MISKLTETDIVKTTNIINFPSPGIETMNTIVYYFSAKLDYAGGVLDNNWGLVSLVIKDMLMFGIKAFLHDKGYYASTLSNDQLFFLFAEECGTNLSDIYSEAEAIMFANVSHSDDVDILGKRCIKLVESVLFSEEFMRQLWNDKLTLTDFSCFQNILVEIHKIAEYIEVNNKHCAMPVSSEKLEQGDKYLSLLFSRD